MALVMALFEIQIEGAKGWAANLPTWKVFYGLFLIQLGVGVCFVTEFRGIKNCGFWVFLANIG